MKLSRLMLPAIGVLAVLRPGAAMADMAQYQNLVTCAAFHQLAYGIYSQDNGGKAHKAAIKYHQHKVKFLIELAGSLLDPYHVPPARVHADTVEAYRGLIERARGGTSFAALMQEGAAACPDLSDN